MEYIFRGRDGQASLVDLFEGRDQPLIYHFMFDPDGDEGCESCSFLADGIGHVVHLHALDTTLAMVSRAPLPSGVAAAQPPGGRGDQHGRVAAQHPEPGPRA